MNMGVIVHVDLYVCPHICSGCGYRPCVRECSLYSCVDILWGGTFFVLGCVYIHLSHTIWERLMQTLCVTVSIIFRGCGIFHQTCAWSGMHPGVIIRVCAKCVRWPVIYKMVGR